MTRPMGMLHAFLLLSLFAPVGAEGGAKKFFLSQDTAFGDHALDACGKGYHMASLWEIFDPTLLKYDTKRGLTLGDAGSGPPAGIQGWIRTGANPSPTPTAGLGNCNAWTSRSNLDFGTVAFLEQGMWGNPAIRTSPWGALVVGCDTAVPVWCRQN